MGWRDVSIWVGWIYVHYIIQHVHTNYLLRRNESITDISNRTYSHKPPISVSFQWWWFRDSFIRIHNIVSQEQVNRVLHGKIRFQTHWRCTLKQRTKYMKTRILGINRLFLSCKLPPSQNKSPCNTTLTKMCFISRVCSFSCKLNSP